MRVSILIPLYQAQDFYRQTIDCALDQTHSDCEVVAVIDDDGHYELPDSVIQVRTGRRGSGPNAARNAGLVWCSGHMIVPLDADDWMHPTRVEKLIPLVKSFGVAGCSEITRNLDTGEIERQVFNESAEIRRLTPKQYLNLNATIHLAFRRDLITRWPESVALAGDTLFNLDAIERAGSVAIHPETLFEYRTHNASHCHRPGSVDRAEAGYQEILRLIETGIIARTPDLKSFAHALFEKKRQTNLNYGAYVAAQGPCSFDHYLESL